MMHDAIELRNIYTQRGTQAVDLVDQGMRVYTYAVPGHFLPITCRVTKMDDENYDCYVQGFPIHVVYFLGAASPREAAEKALRSYFKRYNP